ncbi:MAG: hypothetical protein V1859_11030 [archaeon]
MSVIHKIKIPKDETIFQDDSHSKYYTPLKKIKAAIEPDKKRMIKVKKNFRKHLINAAEAIFAAAGVLLIIFIALNSILDGNDSFSSESVEIDIDLSNGEVSGNSALYKFSINETGNYNLYILSNFENRKNKISVDEKYFTQKVFGEDYMWVNIGDMKLKKGEHSLKIEFPGTGENLLKDGGFEEGTWSGVKDCCKGKSGTESIFAIQSNNSIEKKYSLELGSSSHCACVNQEIKQIENAKSYSISFYYKGDNPYICLWDSGCGICNINVALNSSNEWKKYSTIFMPENCTEKLILHLYANYNNAKVVNNYDDFMIFPLYGGLNKIKLSTK